MEIRKVFPPRTVNAHAMGFPLEFCNGVGANKKGDAPDRHSKSLMISAFVWMQYHNMKDRQTYRLKQYTNIALSMLARDKKIPSLAS